MVTGFLKHSTKSLFWLLSALFAAQLLYTIYVGGDVFVTLRFLLTVLPILYVLAVVGLSELIHAFDGRKQFVVAGLVLFAIPAYVNFGALYGLPTEKLYEKWLETAVSFGQLMQANLPAGTKCRR